jgi:hypothetical protein
MNAITLSPDTSYYIMVQGNCSTNGANSDFAITVSGN